MRLKKIIQLIFPIQKQLSKRVVLICLSFIFYSFSLSAQNFQFNFSNVSVSSALLEVAEKMNIRVSFDSDNLSNFQVSGSFSGTKPEEILSGIIDNTGYKIEFRYNTYLVVRRHDLEKPQHSSVKFKGVVFDKETGEQLPYATVYYLNKNQVLTTTVNGTFGVQMDDSVNAFLQVRYLGYFSLDTVILYNSELKNVNLGLRQKSQTLQTIEVAGENLRMIDQNGEAGHFLFNPSRFSDLPNYGETDVFRALQLLPGISSTENSSQLNIRGSSADQNLVLFDGFTLYNLDHFFGAFSALNPFVIKNVQVYRGGFDSRYGERISGIVDITSKSGNQQKAEIYGGVNLISANLTTEIPVTKKLTIVAAVRRAYTDIYSSWLADALLEGKTGQSNRFPGQEDNTIEPKFYFSDANLKMTYNLSKSDNISLSVYGAKDKLNSSSFSERPDGTVDTEDKNQWGNYGLGIAWKKQWNPSSFTILQGGHSGYFNDYYNNTHVKRDSSKIQPMPQPGNGNFITNENNDLVDYFVSFQNNYTLTRTNQLEWGTAVKFNRYQYYKDATADTSDFVYNNSENSSMLYTVFIQDKINASKKLVLKPGFRANFYNKTQKFYFEPRLTASFQLDKGLILKGAVGHYYQYLNKSATEQTYGYNRDFWVLADDDEHPVLSSNHFIAGASYEVKHLSFDLEAYLKSIVGLQEYLFLDNPQHKSATLAPQPPNPADPGLSQFISGTGTAIGLDFLAKYENTGFTSWLAYSLGKATQNFTEINNGEDIPSAYDQTHQIKWTNIYSWKKWNFSSLTLFSTGQPYVESTSKDVDFNTVRVYNRLPDYFRMDISANYTLKLKNITLNPGLSIINLLNTENYLDIYTRNFDIGGTPMNETTLVKAQKITLNFYLNFRF